VLALADSGCLPTPPGHVWADRDGEAAQHRPMAHIALPAPDGSIHRSFRERLLKKKKGFSRNKPPCD